MANSSDEEHDQHMHLLFKCPCKYGIVINLSKSLFRVESLHFLGHIINKDGIHHLPKKVKAIIDFPPPTSLCNLQEFLSLINFYRKLLPYIHNHSWICNVSEHAKTSSIALNEEQLAFSTTLKKHYPMLPCCCIPNQMPHCVYWLIHLILEELEVCYNSSLIAYSNHCLSFPSN